MSTSEMLTLWVGAPLLISAASWSSYKIWIRRADVSANIEWAVGANGRSGFDATQLPIAVGFLLVWLSLLTTPVWESPPDPSVFSMALGVAGVLAVFGGFWLWLFMWPKFLVPPHLREEQGLLVVAWRSRGIDGPRREGRRKRE